MANQVEQWFKLADQDGDGAVGGAEAVRFFTRSGLPQDVLGQVGMREGSSTKSQPAVAPDVSFKSNRLLMQSLPHPPYPAHPPHPKTCCTTVLPHLPHNSLHPQYCAADLGVLLRWRRQAEPDAVWHCFEAGVTGSGSALSLSGSCLQGHPLAVQSS